MWWMWWRGGDDVLMCGIGGWMREQKRRSVVDGCGCGCAVFSKEGWI